MSRLSSALLPAVALVLVASACAGGDDSSGLATLLDETPAPEIVPESDEVEAAGIAAPPETTWTPPETTGTTTVTTAAVSTTTAGGNDDAADPPATTTTQPGTAESGDGSGAEDPAGEEPTGEEPTGEEPTGEEPSRADLSDEERLLRFADCMRENGVDFPDPVVEADGSVQFGFRPGAGGGGRLQELARDPDLPAAREACEGLLEGLSFGPGSGNFDTTELQDTLLEFARCMRANGVDMGDPDLSNFGPGGDDDGPGGGPFGGAIDFGDPDVAAALAVCQEEVNIGRFAGGGRGGNS